MKSLLFLLASAAATTTAACADADPGPAPLTCDQPIVTTAYRVDAVELARGPGDADRLGSDLDADGTIDNQAGNVFSGLLPYLTDAAAASQLDARLAGGLDWQLERSTCPSTGEARVALRDDLVPLGALLDVDAGADDGWHPVAIATFELDTEGRELAGRIAIGLSEGYQDVIAETIVSSLNARLDRGESHYGFDADDDGEITVPEVHAMDLFEAVLTADLDVDGDGTRESLSLGFGFHATEVAPAR